MQSAFWVTYVCVTSIPYSLVIIAHKDLLMQFEFAANIDCEFLIANETHDPLFR